MRPRFHIGLALALVGACTDQIHLGTEAPAWSADHETGDVSQWSLGGSTAGGQLTTSDASLTVVTSPAHGGRYAVRASINASGNVSFARLSRMAVPQDAYFSVWFYLPARYTIAQYWNVFEFQGRTNPADASTYTPVWSLDLRQGSTGEMMWYVWDGIRGSEVKPSVPVYAIIGRWFRVEAFVHQATDSKGRVALSIDGNKFIEVSGVSTVPTAWMSWSVGSAAPEITEQPADIFIDDATIVVAAQ